MSRLLDQSFKYVPSTKVATEGVLAKWLEQTKAERERRAQEAAGKVVAIKRTKGSR